MHDFNSERPYKDKVIDLNILYVSVVKGKIVWILAVTSCLLLEQTVCHQLSFFIGNWNVWLETNISIQMLTTCQLTGQPCSCNFTMTALAGGFLVTNYHGARFQKIAWTEAENKRDHYFKQLLTVGMGDH